VPGHDGSHARPETDAVVGLKMLREQASGLTRDQRNAFLAAWLG
jgi:hypothetical protein